MQKCITCDVEILEPKEKYYKRKYCSFVCRRGINNPCYGGRITARCFFCDIDFIKRPNDNQKFCSQVCAWKNRSQTSLGDKNPRYKGGNIICRRRKREERRNEVLNVLGGKCNECGNLDRRVLQVDHILGGGVKDRKSFTDDKIYYKYVIESFLKKENKYQILCANCNWIKKHLNNENTGGNGKNARTPERRNLRRKQRIIVVESLGGVCTLCEVNDFRVLQIDHIEGGGIKDRDSYAAASVYYKKVAENYLNDLGKYQLLCANCNWIKRYENNEVRNSLKK